jgi:hypothetical protein
VALALALLACVVVVVWRLEAAVDRYLPTYLAHVTSTQARTVALAEAATKPSPPKPPLPGDLEAIANRETEGWAREQVRAAIQDDFEAHQDWDKVRAHYFGTGE